MRLNGYVQKAWGHENIWCSNEKYCGKLLRFKPGSQFSMHFHKEKDETWYILNGVFEVSFIDTRTAELRTTQLTCGDVWRNEPCEPHQLKCLKEGTIIEVSTPDSVEDNYRVFPGDSQK
jgi:mannose-6-phosphate isomerase-like protein (cupin superfamily)